MAKHSLAVALDVFSQFDAVDGGREEIGEPCLAFLKWKRSLILAVQFEQVEQVERIKDDVMVTATQVQFLEKRKARLGAEHHGLAVDRYRSRSQTRQGLTDTRKAVGPFT